MNVQDFASDDDRFVRQYTYDDAVLLAVDLADTMTEGHVDVVGDTVIVVDENDGEQFEFDVPDVSQAFIRNGVLSIEQEVNA